MNEQKSFDLEDVYDAEVAPLMAQLLVICTKHKLPMFASFLYLNDPEGDDGVCTSFVMPESRPIPEKFLSLRKALSRPSPLHMRVRNGDGAVVEDIVVLP